MDLSVDIRHLNEQLILLAQKTSLIDPSMAQIFFGISPELARFFARLNVHQCKHLARLDVPLFVLRDADNTAFWGQIFDALASDSRAVIDNVSTISLLKLTDPKRSTLSPVSTLTKNDQHER